MFVQYSFVGYALRIDPLEGFTTGSLGGASWVRDADSATEPAPSFVSPALLAYDLPQGSAPQLALLVETELLRLGACEARLELDLGRVLGRVTLEVAKDLGFSSLAAFSRERLGFSWSHAREMAAIARALESLPLTRAAFLAGALPRCKVREIVRVAEPLTEGAWVVLARRVGTRALHAAVGAELAARRALRAARDAGGATTAASEPRPAAALPDAEVTERVELRTTAGEALFVEHVGKPMLRAIVGVTGPDHVLFEALAADALSDLGPEEVEGDAPPRVRRRRCRPRLPRHRGAPHRPAGDASPLNGAAARRVLHRFACRLGGVPAVAWPDVREVPSSPHRLVSLAARLVAWRHAIAWQRGRLLSLVLARGFHRERGHRHFAEWHELRLGLSPKEARGLVALADAVAHLPALADAWRDGRLAPVHVRLLARVASHDTAAEWVAFALDATAKRLETEVGAHLALRAELGELRWRRLTGGRPLRDARLGALRLRWDVAVETALGDEARESAGRSRGRGVRAAGSEPFDALGRPDDRDEDRAALAETASEGRARAWVRFEAPKDVASLFRRALRGVGRALCRPHDQGACLVAMCWRFARTHAGPGLADRARRARVLRRDGWECAMPHCRSRRHLDVHHGIFRSQGGSDDEDNLVTLCSACHRLLHEGGLHVELLPGGRILVRVGRMVPRSRGRPGRADENAPGSLVPATWPVWYLEGVWVAPPGGSEEPS